MRYDPATAEIVNLSDHQVKLRLRRYQKLRTAHSRAKATLTLFECAIVGAKQISLDYTSLEFIKVRRMARLIRTWELQVRKWNRKCAEILEQLHTMEKIGVLL